jgi:hypothetical protein
VSKNPYLTLFDRTTTHIFLEKIFFNPYQQDVGSPEIREPEIPDNSRILIISFSTYIRKRAALTSADF